METTNVNEVKTLKKSKRTGRDKVVPIGWAMFAFLVVHCFTLMFLYLWGLSTSVKTTYQFMSDMVGLPKGAPWDWAWSNYSKAFSLFNMNVLRNGVMEKVTVLDMLGNTLTFAILSILMGKLADWPVAYVSVMFWNKFKLARFLHTLVYVMMFIPAYGTMASGYLFYKKLGMYDNWWYVIFAYYSFPSGFILTHAYLEGISREMSEAAKIDGANNFQIMLKLYLPLSMPVIGLQFLTGFIGAWQNYDVMLYWLPSHPSLAYGMYKFTTSLTQGASWPTIQMAGAVLMIIPVLIIFAFCHKKILGGVSVSIDK